MEDKLSNPIISLLSDPTGGIKRVSAATRRVFFDNPPQLTHLRGTFSDPKLSEKDALAFFPDTRAVRPTAVSGFCTMAWSGRGGSAHGCFRCTQAPLITFEISPCRICAYQC